METWLISNLNPSTRARIRALRATSTPPRSSRGSGSVKPSAFALLTTTEKGSPSCSADITNPRVPLSEPAILVTRSADATTRCRLAMAGRPAPTVDSSRTRGPDRPSHASIDAVTGFLLANTARMSVVAVADSSAGSVASVAVQSTTMAPAAGPVPSTTSRRNSLADTSAGRASQATPEPLAVASLPPRSLCAIRADSASSLTSAPPSAGRTTPDESQTASALSRRPYRSACSARDRTMVRRSSAPTPPTPSSTKGTERCGAICGVSHEAMSRADALSAHAQSTSASSAAARMGRSPGRAGFPHLAGVVGAKPRFG
eukprot:scaffold19864_cov101-Isochrysis_galbana.AAC.2